jgi:pantetheine-phosphate adenylyltransferase
MQFIGDTFSSEKRIKIASYTGLTVQFCKEINARFILRGLRNTSDFNYEQPIAQTNYKMAGIESIFLIASPEVSNISSSIVRDVMRNNGDYGLLVPKTVKTQF